MNNDSSPSSAARAADITSNNNTTAASDERQPGRANGPSNAASLHPERRRRPKRRKKKHDPGLRKKFDFMTHLLKNLDALFFAELSAVYYMECSLFRLLARVCSQAVFLAPRTEAFPILMEINRLSFILILLPNLYCLLVHIFTPVPTGPEYHRGYQHGGVIIDFVGQKPPQYKLYYVLLDFFLLALQLLIYTIQHEREQLRKKLGLFKIPAQPQQVLLAGRTLQELDQEERGEAGLDETEDIELREMQGASRDDNAVTSRDDSTGPPRGDGSSSRRSSEDGPSASHLADMMISGNAIIGEFRVIHSIRSATGHPLETAGQSLQTIGYSATFAALDARRRSAAVRAGAIPQA